MLTEKIIIIPDMCERVEVIRKLFINALAPSLTDDQKNELLKLINNNALSKHELNVKIKESCKDAGDKAMSKYSDITNTFIINETKILKKLKNVGERFSPETRISLQEAAKIYGNQAISYEKEYEELQKLFENASTEVQHELTLFGEPFSYYTKAVI